MLKVSVMDHRQTYFEGVANSVILPGDYGEFEVMEFHKTIISLLVAGEIIIDNVGFPISRGIVCVENDELVALVEL